MDNRPILPNWGIQYAWLESVGFWKAWLALPVNYVEREKIPDGQPRSFSNEEKLKMKEYRDLEESMKSMKRPWDLSVDATTKKKSPNLHYLHCADLGFSFLWWRCIEFSISL
jgi:hypothetical protein